MRVKVRKHGRRTIPAKLEKKLKIKEDSLEIKAADGILITKMCNNSFNAA
jgi:bifunctional DNA-binding transcriptional regulator/antitoxin component of YhaV-PrlF toxin-antitoxin module